MNIIEQNYVMKIDNLLQMLDAINDNETLYQQKDTLTGCIIDSVHALADCYERKKKKISETDKEFILAFCYLNNQLKHDRELQVFSKQIYSAVLPTRLPLCLGNTSFTIIWENFEDHGRTTAEAKRKYYDKHLNGKNIKDTLSTAKQILDSIISIE